MSGVDANRTQRHTQAQRHVAAVALEIIGLLLQAVVNVERMHLLGPALGTGRQQRGGIGAATEANGERQRWRSAASAWSRLWLMGEAPCPVRAQWPTGKLCSDDAAMLSCADCALMPLSSPHPPPS